MKSYFVSAPKSPLTRGLVFCPLVKGGWGDWFFNISSKSFFQPNTKQAEILYSKVLEFADLKGDEIVFDIYCGTGTIGIILSKFVKKVYGFEIVEDAIKDAKANAMLNTCNNIEFLCGDVKDTIKDLQENPDVIILDPPRAGLSPKALENILALQSRVSSLVSRDLKIIYISCNPTTQARDLKILCDNGFELVKCQPVDMFPHTYHIENIAVLRKI